MQRNVLGLFFLFWFSFSWATQARIEWINKQEGLVEQDRDVFVHSFLGYYSGLRDQNLDEGTLPEDIETFLNDAFDDEENDFLNDGFRALRIIIDDVQVGYASIDINQENNEIYLRQVGVLPNYQRKGLGSEVLDHLLEELPDTRKINLVTRRINRVSQDFAKKNGFVESEFLHEHYDPNIYIAFSR